MPDIAETIAQLSECPLLNRPRKPERKFLQIDGFQACPPGLSEEERRCYSVHPDEDGQAVMAIIVMEPRNTDFPVRIQIHEGSDKVAVLRLLTKITQWLESDFDGLMGQAPYPVAAVFTP